jgi:tetratricopeptide (TPR) repeat protein
MLLLPAVLLAIASHLFGQVADSENAPSLAKAHKELENGKHAEALAMLDQLATVKPAVPGLQREYGIVYYRTGQLVKAQRVFTAAIQEDPSDQESVQMEGLTLYRLGRPAEAIPYLERMRQWTRNGNADANQVLGLCYMNSQRYEDARAAFSKAFKVEPDSAASYLLMGSMLMKANLTEMVAPQVEKAIVLQPNLPLAHFLLGEVYLYKSDMNRATEEFERERRLNPGYAAVYDRLGDVYLRADKLQEAQEVLARAISLDTSSTGPFILMGKVLLRKQDPVTSVMYLKHAEQMDNSNFITHTLLAQAYRKMGQKEEAERETELASKIHAANQPELKPLN